MTTQPTERRPVRLALTAWALLVAGIAAAALMPAWWPAVVGMGAFITLAAIHGRTLR